MDHPFGSFTQEALEAYQKAVAEKEGVEFAEGGIYDFTRCVRPDGTAYGTKGECRKGAEEAKQEVAPTARKSAGVDKPAKVSSVKAKSDLKEMYASLMKKQQELVAKNDFEGAGKLNAQISDLANKITQQAAPAPAKLKTNTEKLRKAINNELKTRGEKPTPPKAASKPEAKSAAPKEKSPLKTPEDYDKLMKSTLRDKEALAAHKRARNFDSKSKSADRLEFEKAMGGKEEANKALKEITDFGALYFSAIRGAQRGDSKYFKDKSLMGEYKEKAAIIEKAVKAMPHPEVEKYRGMSVSNSHLKSLIKQAKGGGSYKSDALDSWSTNLQTADQFARRRTDDEYPNSVVFRTRNKNGASIKPFSPVPGEDEILTPSGSSYRFTGYNVIERNGEKIHVFEVDES
jgi:hypothetical protein